MPLCSPSSSDQFFCVLFQFICFLWLTLHISPLSLPFPPFSSPPALPFLPALSVLGAPCCFPRSSFRFYFSVLLRHETFPPPHLSDFAFPVPFRFFAIDPLYSPSLPLPRFGCFLPAPLVCRTVVSPFPILPCMLRALFALLLALRPLFYPLKLLLLCSVGLF